MKKVLILGILFLLGGCYVQPYQYGYTNTYPRYYPTYTIESNPCRYSPGCAPAYPPIYRPQYRGW
jgi:hypothetical protein